MRILILFIFLSFLSVFANSVYAYPAVYLKGGVVYSAPSACTKLGQTFLYYGSAGDAQCTGFLLITGITFSCPGGYTVSLSTSPKYNNVTGQYTSVNCAENVPVSCPSPGVRDDSVAPSVCNYPPVTCTWPKVRDALTNTCVTFPDCPTGKIPDPNVPNACKWPDITCPIHQHVSNSPITGAPECWPDPLPDCPSQGKIAKSGDPYTCVNRDPTCLGNDILSGTRDMGTATCIAPPDLICPTGSHYTYINHTQDCQLDTPTTKQCPGGQTIPIANTCPPATYTCPGGQVVTDTANCPPLPPGGQTQTKTCPDGSVVGIADICHISDQGGSGWGLGQPGSGASGSGGSGASGSGASGSGASGSGTGETTHLTGTGSTCSDPTGLSCVSPTSGVNCSKTPSDPSCKQAGSGAGSGSCDKQPTCSGDPVQCAQLVQSWHVMCYREKISTKPSDVLGSDDTQANILSAIKGTATSASVTSQLDAADYTKIQDECLPAETIHTAYGDIAIPYTLICKSANIVRFFVISSALILSIFIIF